MIFFSNFILQVVQQYKLSADVQINGARVRVFITFLYVTFRICQYTFTIFYFTFHIFTSPISHYLFYIPYLTRGTSQFCVAVFFNFYVLAPISSSKNGTRHRALWRNYSPRKRTTGRTLESFYQLFYHLIFFPFSLQAQITSRWRWPGTIEWIWRSFLLERKRRPKVKPEYRKKTHFLLHFRL